MFVKMMMYGILYVIEYWVILVMEYCCYFLFVGGYQYCWDIYILCMWNEKNYFFIIVLYFVDDCFFLLVDVGKDFLWIVQVQFGYYYYCLWC